MIRTETTTKAPYAVLNLRGQSSEEDLTKNRNAGPMSYNGSLEQYEVSCIHLLSRSSKGF